MLCGDEIVKSDALEEAAELSEVLGCAIVQSTIPYGAHFLSERPCYVGGLNGEQPQVRATLNPSITMLVLGSDVLRMSVWQRDRRQAGPSQDPAGRPGRLGDRQELSNGNGDQGRRQETIKALIPVLKKKGGKALEERAKKGITALAKSNWTAKRKALVAKIEKMRTPKPIKATG